MNDHTSLGSQPQYRPQADSAQIAPQMMANVQIGNANLCSRNVSRSSEPLSGSREPMLYGKRRLPCSYPCLMRNRMAGTTATSRRPDAVAAADTWIFNQYELSAGTSGAAAVYRTVSA